MSRVSIYETRWINLIFENKNQQYGAYQLRRESVKSSLTALFMGLLFVASIGGITTIASHFNRVVAPTITSPEWSDPIEVTKVDFQKIEEPMLPEAQSQATEATILKDQLINPVIVQSQDAVQDIATNVENKYASDVLSDGTGTIELNPSSSGNGTETTKAVDYGTTVVNAAVLDKLPQFPGGIEKFYNYVGNNFEKPEIEDIATLRVYVSFVIEKDGSMTDIKVSRDPGYGLGREAIRVLKSLRTKWSPGIIDSKPVRTAYSLPIVLEMK
ncbi:energy transducer TonB [Flavobacterium sp.]|uniref:energy transducer TonB n=1 Tax=Flavobacterium sp. TaxID=239 RepID=UPI0025BFF8B4|nr:energy transducer TonB [Flavobacterium sp.]MBA4277143.1 ferric siderophore ABC transporter substrate-binding protein [Flavobacterium sp.]